MNNLLITALTFLTIASFAVKTYAKSYPDRKNAEIITVSKEVVLAQAFHNNNTKQPIEIAPAALVDIDYIVNENGKAYVTYVHCNDDAIKLQAIQFIENAPIYAPYELGKVYSLQLKLTK